MIKDEDHRYFVLYSRMRTTHKDGLRTLAEAGRDLAAKASVQEHFDDRILIRIAEASDEIIFQG
ncbi:hypothetical protein ACFIOY_35035 [Bradyrhizobium sp. TZ2]